MIQKTFGFSHKEVLAMPATTFEILLDEIVAENKREEERMNRSKNARFGKG